MSAAVFSIGRLHEYSLESAHQTLTPLLGPLAGMAFAIALLASGLASSTTATMADQVIMDGFIHHKMNVWLRRAVTMIPSLIVIGLGIDPLQILALFTSSRQIMGEFTNNRVTRVLAWLTTAVILSLNTVLLYQIFTGQG